MAAGDVFEVTTGECEDLHYVDTGMYDSPEYGSVYVLDAERPAVIDTGIGTNYERVVDAIEEVGLSLDDIEVIAVTHVHLDHAGGAGFLARDCPNADVYVHEIGARHLADPERLVEGTKRAVGDQWEYYVEPRSIAADRIVELSDGDAIDLGDHELIAHHAPGHAPHQVVFEDPANDAVFTADAAGIWVPSLDQIEPTSPPSNFDLEAALDDVEMLQDLGVETLLFAHFGPCPADGVLDEYADVLAEWVDAVERERAEQADDEAVIEHFAGNVDPELVEVWGEHKTRAETAMNVRGVLGYLDQR
ncbi:Glyoxylase, beta-lactamase superfamily II [Natronoarchaeum philippinense]|uniref:Glyoxylase, beta-lactamase superfamily II n=1 Tax=Natronoarchaeum philippinense TaxID=558529 RepID=A0A285P3C8_NATPI|nr:MBL fold metallo-hydrolase [Natronoarchaeum philippinense]SNZ16242.1 Glyoxylase, beta-lactamase superfamily II [Natronoarchaeum philippinense]